MRPWPNSAEVLDLWISRHHFRQHEKKLSARFPFSALRPKGQRPRETTPHGKSSVVCVGKKNNSQLSENHRHTSPRLPAVVAASVLHPGTEQLSAWDVGPLVSPSVFRAGWKTEKHPRCTKILVRFFHDGETKNKTERRRFISACKQQAAFGTPNANVVLLFCS